jgi:hypothetical protein
MQQAVEVGVHVVQVAASSAQILDNFQFPGFHGKEQRCAPVGRFESHIQPLVNEKLDTLNVATPTGEVERRLPDRVDQIEFVPRGEKPLQVRKAAEHRCKVGAGIVKRQKITSPSSWPASPPWSRISSTLARSPEAKAKWIGALLTIAELASRHVGSHPRHN